MTCDQRPRRARPAAPIVSPFTRTRRLLERAAPGHAKPIDLTIGDPREAMPAFVSGPAERGQGAVRQLSQDPRLRRSAPVRSPHGSGGATASSARSTRCARSFLSAARAKACSSPPSRRPGASGCGPAGDAHRQSFLPGLSGRGLRHQLRAGVSQRDRRDGPPARSRCARARARSARAHGGVLFVLAGQPAGRGGGCRLYPQGAGARAPARLHAVLRRMLFGDLHARCARRRAAGRAARRRSVSGTSWCSTRSRSARTCPACARASRPAMARSWKRWPRSAT